MVPQTGKSESQHRLFRVEVFLEGCRWEEWRRRCPGVAVDVE